MRIYAFLFALSFCSLAIGQKLGLKPYTDTLVFSYNSIAPSAGTADQLSLTNPYIQKDSHQYKSIYLDSKYPIQKASSNSTLECTRIDTFIVNSYVGKPDLQNFTDYTFFNPTEDLVTAIDWRLPLSAVYYQNPSKVDVDLNQFTCTTTQLINCDINDFFRPFFFMNSEVTNMLYREFVHYTRDSIARRILGDEFDADVWLIPTFDSLGQEKDESDWYINWVPIIDWEKHSENEQFPYLAPLFFGENDRFYDRLEIDPRQLMYKYEDDEGSVNVINVYPDTTCWIKRFSIQSMEPLSNMYFWHPAYDNYPVVGITWHQAKAFCHWITEKTNKELSQIPMPYKVKFDLPSMIQWDYVRNSIRRENHALTFFDFSWETNLILTQEQSNPVGAGGDTTYLFRDFEDQEGKLTRKNLLNKPLNPFVSSNCDYPFNKNLLLSKKYIQEEKKVKDPPEVLDMGTGVSEWLQESYADNWKLMYYKRMELLLKTSGADADIQALLEEYFDAFNDPNGRLVIGANWFDFRDEYYEGKSFESMDAKIFANPEEGYPTVGFRLVLFIEPIEE